MHKIRVVFHLTSPVALVPEMTAATGTERNAGMSVFTSSMVTSISTTATANVCSMMSNATYHVHQAHFNAAQILKQNVYQRQISICSDLVTENV